MDQTLQADRLEPRGEPGARGDSRRAPTDRTTFRIEALAIALVLSAIAVAVYGQYAIDGGFLSDTWSHRALYVFSPHQGFFGEIGWYLEKSNLGQRPLWGIYLLALNGVFGSHMGFWLAWLSVTSVAASLSLYLLLRKLDFGFADAGLIAALLLIFPATTSLRMWTATEQVSASMTLAILGFLLAFIAFDARDKRRLALHGASLALFVMSQLLYEAAMPVMLASVLVYRLRVPWRQAARRWAVDFVVLIGVYLLVTSIAPGAKEIQGVAGMWHHAVTIYRETPTLLQTIVLPFNSGHWYLLCLIGLLPLAAAVAALRLPPGDPGRAELLRWLFVLGAAVALVLLAYTIFVPGLDLYTPLGPGDLNRVNVIASIGWVLVLYALARLAATLALRGVAGSRTLVPALAFVACVLVAVGWLESVSRQADAYTTGFREDERVLGVIRGVLPNPRRNSTIWTVGQALEVIPGVPVFGNTWDMTGSVQLAYDDPTLKSYPGMYGLSFECRKDAIVPRSPYPPAPPHELGEFGSRYGRTYFVDTSTGNVALIRTPAQCLRAADSFPRSPALVGEPPPPAPPSIR